MVASGIEVIAAIVLFTGTPALDRAAYMAASACRPGVIAGSAGAPRQILTAIAAAVITVVGFIRVIAAQPMCAGYFEAVCLIDARLAEDRRAAR